MSNIAQDIKSGLKGIKGAGDAVRGSVLQAGDEIFDPKGANHPDTAAAQAKNRAIAEQGAAEASAADNDIGARHGTNASSKNTSHTAAVGGQTGVVGSTGTGSTGMDTAATGTTAAPTTSTTHGTAL
ncbi:hypothetical protein N0V82_010550 [Gnomoniopsis sp. IMI 355080]|nr:hypothetical protein N0V82_010550 [Gnomoniopsis sp. IMI 355080]